MATIPEIAARKKRAYSPLESVYKKSEIHLEGSAVVMPNGDRQEFATNAAAWEAFKKVKKAKGQWY